MRRDQKQLDVFKPMARDPTIQKKKSSCSRAASQITHTMYSYEMLYAYKLTEHIDKKSGRVNTEKKHASMVQ
jgi:hypothetical protein